MSGSEKVNSMNGHKKFWIITCIIIAIVVIGFLGYKLFMIEKIEVKGNSVYSGEQIAEMASVPLNTHALVLDEEQIKKNIESDPFLIVNSIEYVMPGMLKINVSERIPVAKFSYLGDMYFVTEEMLVISDDEHKCMNINLILDGLNLSDVKLGEEPYCDIPYKNSVLKEILRELLYQNAVDIVSRIDVTDVNSIRMNTVAGFDVVFGQGDNYESKIKWICLMIEKLVSEGKTAGEIDVSSGDSATFRDETPLLEESVLIVSEESSDGAVGSYTE